MHIPESAFARFNACQREESEALKAIFARYTANKDFCTEFRPVKPEAVSASERLVEGVRSADLVMMAHEDNDGDRHDQQQVIRDGGWPVIVVPLTYDGPTVGDNILLGWSDTREAPRADHDLLTVTEKGTKVKVLRVGKNVQDTMADSDAIDLSEMLSRHDLKPTLEHREAKGDAIVDALNNVALESGADLIVTGATTHALLRDAKLPILIQ